MKNRTMMQHNGNTYNSDNSWTRMQGSSECISIYVSELRQTEAQTKLPEGNGVWRWCGGMYRKLERRSVSGVSRWTYSVRGIGEQRCPLTTPSSAPGPKAGPAPKKARAPRKAKTTAPTILSAMAIPSVNICSTTLQVAPVEKITVSVSIPDKLARHLIGQEGTGLHQIHNISHAKMLVHPHSVSGVHVVITRGSSLRLV